jgi:hypothetical protein
MSLHRTALPQPVEEEVDVGSTYAAVRHLDENLLWTHGRHGKFFENDVARPAIDGGRHSGR